MDLLCCPRSLVCLNPRKQGHRWTVRNHKVFISASWTVPAGQCNAGRLESRRRRLFSHFLIRSKPLYHSVHLNIKTLFVGFPTLEISSDSGLYFGRQNAQVPMVSEHIAVKVQRFSLRTGFSLSFRSARSFSRVVLISSSTHQLVSEFFEAQSRNLSQR
jgi:hypothetical protein